jgi:hypothetical protein
MVTKCLDSECRIQMKLVDWLILAEGSEKEDFIPCPSETIINDDGYESDDSCICSDTVCGNAFRIYHKGRKEGLTHEDMVPHHTAALRNCNHCNPAKKACAPLDFSGTTENISLSLSHPDESLVFPLGTKLRWTSSEDLSYRVAIITKKGTLLVKESDTLPGVETRVSYPRQFYETPMAWYKSLPQNGKVEATVYKNKLDEKNKVVEDSIDHVNLVKELMERFNVKQYVEKINTASENLELYKGTMIGIHQNLAKFTIQNDIEFPRDRLNQTKRLSIHVNRFKNYERLVNAMTPQQRNWRPIANIYSKSRSALWLIVDNQRRLLAINNDGKIVVSGHDPVDSFQQIPNAVFVNGKPKLIVLYRKKMINAF